MTVVATSTSSSPARNAAIAASFSADFICPCSSPSRSPASSPAASASSSSVAALASIFGEPSTSGHTTYAWRPAATCSRSRSYATARSSGLGPITSVVIGVRPGGISCSSLRSRSP